MRKRSCPSTRGAVLRGALPLFARYATTNGLDEKAFTSTLDDTSARLNRKINFDIALGRKLNVTGTPTFYLNGKQLTNDKYSDQAAFEKTLQEAFKAQGVKYE